MIFVAIDEKRLKVLSFLLHGRKKLFTSTKDEMKKKVS